MISITVYKHQENYVRLFCSGHAGYDVRGRDIVCASVSVLVINTINALDRLTSDEISLHSDEDTGEIDCRLTSPVSKEAALLLDALVLGLTEIQKSYGKTYITLSFEEV